ncbi:PREDICTED: probable serine/threonine-protein kinase At4g35230 isoform X2 [Tarenaya hassleriana]|uniref:probable serine/threonine-protein kinase At4g35230 isoform X2 n=1 Tax=Tarenaya hassleriana TaxID=28532 RepID=UPI00053C23F2|nr:PREDICTED: probable serine/threonine-protein kinase At4g35230 isoform X2 [Tarenaya hassleriana]
MGCCESTFLKPLYLLAKTSVCGGEKDKRRRNHHPRNGKVSPPPDGRGWNFSAVPDISEFSLADLRSATDNFSSDALVSVSTEKSQDTVYRGYLRRGRDVRWIAVKKFCKSAWPDTKQFAAEARAIGRLRHKRMVNLIGYCCDGDERLLVSEYMPNDTLTKHLFHWENQTMEWAMRLRVALFVAEALEFCSLNERRLYHDLNPYRVLFDEHGNPRLSCYGLIKNSRDGKYFSTNLAYTPPEYLKNESVIFSFGTFLLDLLSAKHIPPGHALDTIQKQNILVLMDSHLEGNYPPEEAALVFDLACKCLQNEPRDRPDIKDIVSIIAALQHKLDIPSHVMLGIPQFEAPPTQHPHSPIYDACSRMDLTALHQILEATEYAGDEGTCELSFQQWAQQIKDVWDTRQRGDSAFRARDFKSAIEKYTQFIETGIMLSPTIYARRCVCHLFCEEPDAALRDAMQAQCIYPDWPTAFYLQAVALAKLDMLQDSQNMLAEASDLEHKSLISN